MRGRVVGWIVSLGILVGGAAFAAVVAARNEENRRRAADSARLLRERTLASAAHLRDRTTETAQDLREQWTGTALEVRDRWTTTAEEVRARAIDTAEDWRERSSEGFERRLRQAAEAREDSLAALPDDDDEPEAEAPETDQSEKEAETAHALAPELVGPFADWIAGQRWFANSTADHITVEASVPLMTSGDIRILIVRDDAPDARAVYQVPVVEVEPAKDEHPDGLILDGVGPGVVLVDGPRNLDFAAYLVELMLTASPADPGEHGSAQGVVVGWSGPPPRIRAARVLAGEQSNTSIIVDAERGDGSPISLMMKVFRALHHGDNPDVVLQSAIAAAGSNRVPATYGAVTGSWPDPTAPGGVAHGHLAVAQEFLAGTEDAWRVALDAARAGEDFTARAHALGAATAEVHRVLAEAMPTAEADGPAQAAALASMRSRAAQAISLVPSLGASGDAISAALKAGIAGTWPRLQRVHGDYHLGQVLQVPDRGWVLLDFEGEPLRPMSERNEPDLALRDVAGMLRSFDYVAGTIEVEGGDTAAARSWSAAARTGFLGGYEAELGGSLAPYAPLLTALELDKALYECVYEVRNRPAWLPIPERAAHRLLGAAA